MLFVVIDDNPDDIFLSTRAISRRFSHAKIVTFQSGDAAIREISQQALKPFACIVDQVFDSVLQGDQIVRCLRQLPSLRETRFIIFTGDDNADSDERILSVKPHLIQTKTGDIAIDMFRLKRSLGCLSSPGL